MDIGLLFLYSVLSITSAVIYFILGVWRRKYCRLPPGPPGWPIVGNLLQLGNKPNESLFHLSAKYGPLMCLSLGMQTTVVASSPAMAKEILKTHDHLLAGRTVVQSLKSISHEKSSIIFAQCGSHWRMLRRISNTELFSVKRLEALQHLRRDQVNRTIREIFEDAVKGKCVDIGHTVFHSAVNLLGNMAFGKGVFDLHSQAAEEFKDIVSKLMELNGIPNIADFFPFLQFLDPQGISRDVKFYMGKKFDIIDKFIDGRLATRGKSSDISDDGEKDLLDVLLDMRSDEFTVTDIRGYLTDIFGAGSDTTTTTIEWAMAELIRNPEIMKRAHKELDEVVGDKRKVEESDTDRLPYLRAVVKEVFRLHPTVPLLVPHKADRRCEVGGFVIPKNSEILVNVWAIGRDPAIWNEPSRFMPERFICGDKKINGMEYRGQHFELIPFGAGRRMCVGLPLASRMVHLVLGSLLHSFEWAPPDGMNPEQVDMTDKFGLTLKKAVPLYAIPTPRLPCDMYY
jgi:cytochrome P450